MELDFSRVARRKAKTDYDSSCPHDDDCYVWQSSDGPVPVCQMGDFHLKNALEKALRGAEVDSLWADDMAEAVPFLENEIRLRGLK